MTPRIALISAVPAAIHPAESAIRDQIPDAELWNILDDRLLSDADNRGGLDENLRNRMNRLIEHALGEGADAVLLTCSLYGTVAQQFDADVPVLAPDDAAFAAVARGGFERVLVVASFEGAKADTMARLDAFLRGAGAQAQIIGVAVPAAMAPAKTGDQRQLVQALIDGSLMVSESVDAVLLAQYSLAPAGEELEVALGVPVLSGPLNSASLLRQALTNQLRDAS
ncbi:Asp/Glu/hydantoin racemase [Microbacterium sp. BE35]|uniref:hypothetical protein n=1 Tax=Microbacterium sp. BE35 TaxID=2817773 RepID=UPI00285F5E60|nr:hypothetical protein [Microbacterium sp. BE35]MDR7188239.1 Asp/Glu/hydantoin racemase [Microbacterium sp. BE35]